MSTARSIRAGRAFVEFFLEDGPLQRGLKRTEAKIGRTQRRLKKAGSAMVGGGIAALTTVALPFKKFADFDDAIRATGAAAQASDKELARLTDRALELGRTTSFSAVEVANLMTELGRAGFSVPEIDAMTASVLDLSRATGTDAAQSAGIMAATLRQFGMGASEASRVSDVLTHAANSTFNTVEALGQAMEYAGPVAADLGMSLEDTVAILGTLGNVGVQGSSAGNAVRRLATLTAAEADKMSKVFGVAFKDAAGNALPLVDVLDSVAKATNGLPTAERAAKFNEAFGLLGITAASSISKSAAQTKDLADELRQAAGAAGKTAKEMDSGPGGALRRLSSAFEGFMLAVGKAAAPVAGQLIPVLNQLTSWITRIVEKNPGLIQGFTQIALTVVGVGATLIAASMGLKLFLFAFSKLSPLLKIVVGGFKLLTFIPAVLTALLSPAGLLIAAIGSIAAYALHASGALDAMTSFLSSRVGPAWQTIVKLVKSGDLAAAANLAVAGIKATFKVGLATVQGYWARFKGEVAKTFLSLTNSLENAWDSLGGMLVDTMSRAFAKIRSLWQGAQNGLAKIIAASIAKATGQDVDEVLATLEEDQQRNQRDYVGETEREIAQRQKEREQRRQRNDENTAAAMAEVDRMTESAASEASDDVAVAKKAFDEAQKKANGLLAGKGDKPDDDPASPASGKAESDAAEFANNLRRGAASVGQSNDGILARTDAGQKDILAALSGVRENDPAMEVRKLREQNKRNHDEDMRLSRSAPRLRGAKT